MASSTQPWRHNPSDKKRTLFIVVYFEQKRSILFHGHYRQVIKWFMWVVNIFLSFFRSVLKPDRIYEDVVVDIVIKLFTTIQIYNIFVCKHCVFRYCCWCCCCCYHFGVEFPRKINLFEGKHQNKTNPWLIDESIRRRISILKFI